MNVAHVSEDGLREQTVTEHDGNTGRIASRLLEKVGLSKCGTFSGEHHDMGKMVKRFKKYVLFGGKKGSVIHTFQSVQYIMERFGETGNVLAAEVLAYVCGGHHGLFDCVDSNGSSGFEYRMTKQNIDYQESVDNFEKYAFDSDTDMRMFQEAAEELQPFLDKIVDLSGIEKGAPHGEDELMFYMSLLVRLLLSAVVDADRRDTANFMDGVEFPDVRSDAELEQLWSELRSNVEGYAASLDKHDDMSAARNRIAGACRDGAANGPGVYRFKAPCGGGKTVSGAIFTAHNILSGDKIGSRIIFAAPWLSILDQNAEVLKKAFGRRDLVLECHSNVVNDRGTNEDDYKENYKQLSETWDSPVVVTTAVQLLDVLFSGSMHSVRRFHSLCNSVIVIDEVQSVPAKMSTIFSLAVNFLVKVCGASFVFCSATQPCFEEIEHGIRLPIRNLCPDELAADPVFARTRIVFDGTMSLQEIAGSAANYVQDARSVLIVCNKKSQARKLYRMLEGKADCVEHLSASMCQAHREDVISRLGKLLDVSSGPRTETVICVSTQVVEAGVDLSFGSVIRLFAGLDSIVQAAGRCNRHGELGIGIVHVVKCEGETMSYLPDIRRAQDAMQEFLVEFDADPQRFDGELGSDSSIKRYYEILYKNRMGTHLQDYPCGDGTTIYDLMSLNEKFCKMDPGHALRQALRTAGEKFRVFDGGRVDVIMDYGEGADIIRNLNSGLADKDVKFLIENLRKAKRYTVSLFESDVKRLDGKIIRLRGGALGLIGHYDKSLGFFTGEEGSDMQFWSV